MFAMLDMLLNCNAALFRKSNACLMMQIFRHPDDSKRVFQRKTGTILNLVTSRLDWVVSMVLTTLFRTGATQQKQHTAHNYIVYIHPLPFRSIVVYIGVRTLHLSHHPASVFAPCPLLSGGLKLCRLIALLNRYTS